MPRKKSEAVPARNGPVHQEEEFGSGQPAPVDVFQRIEEIWDRGIDEMMRCLEQHIASQEQDARQSRLAMKADGTANTKTRERTEGAATVVQAMRGDSCTAQKVQDGPKTSTSFGVKAEPPDFPCREDVLVEDGAAAPKSCLPFLEMRSRTAAGGLVPTGETSTATNTTYNKKPLRLYATEETNPKEKNPRTSTLSALYESSFWKLLAALSCRKVIGTKSRQNRTSDPGGSQGRLRACPFLGSWRALLCGEVMRAGAAG